MSNRTPLHRKPSQIDDAFAIESFRGSPSSHHFPIPPTIQTDYEKWLMTDVPHTNYSFELVRNWYEREENDYEPEFIRGMFSPINWKSKVGNSDANSVRPDRALYNAELRYCPV